MKRLLPAEWIRTIKKHLNNLEAAECFGDFLRLGIGRPEQLTGYNQIRYSLRIASNARLIIEPNATQDTSPNANLQTDLTNVMAKYGIKFSVVHNFRGAPVHGYISQNKNGEYQMALTIRGAYADIFWFSFSMNLGIS